MSDRTKIEWTDATWDPITGCTVVSPGCTNCYAMRLAGTRLRHHPSRAGLTRDTKAGPVWNGEVRFNKEWLTKPVVWKRPRRIFVCAHGDLFHHEVPDEWIDRVFAVMALAPQHRFQVLTKRAARMREYMAIRHSRNEVELAAERIKPSSDLPVSPKWCFRWPLPNVWLGVSAEDQKRADERIPELLATPAAVRFVSLEPLLGPIDLRGIWDHCPTHDFASGFCVGPCPDRRRLDWVIVGGESGPHARPIHPDWVRSLRDQCVPAGVPFFFKRWGEWIAEGIQMPAPLKRAPDIYKRRWVTRDDGDDRYTRTAAAVHPVGKRVAGRLLDGVSHNGMPQTAT